jgi:putative NADH-flavin reductase
MRIVVFGAAGRTGRLVVQKALGHGHHVKAVIHKASLPIEHEHLVRVSGDVRDLASVRGAVAGADAVILAVSASSGGGSGFHEAAVANIIYAMAENQVGRLAVISAAGAFDRNSRRLTFPFRMLAATVLRSTYNDLEAMERRVMASDLAWTIVRPHHMTEEPPTGHYRVSLDGSLLQKASRIPRGDVASMLVKAVETDTYYRRAVVVAS